MRVLLIHQRRFYLSGWLVLMLCSMALAQSRSNPFEIKPRLKTMQIVDTLMPSLPTNATVSGSIDTLGAGSVDSLSGVQKSAAANGGSLSSDNPFEVDHVPIRRSPTAKRTENLQKQADNTQVSNGFLFWFLLLTSGLLAVVLNSKSKAVGILFRSIFNENMLKLFQREEQTKVSTYLILLYFIFIVNVAIYVYLVSAHFGAPKGIFVFLMILLGAVIVYLIRHFGLFLFGNAFLVAKNTELYSFTIMVFNQFAGVILIGINFLLAFGPEGVQEFMIWASFIFIGLLILLRTFRGIFIVSEHLGDRIFQIIIYLCAFEVAPILILIKTLLKFG